MPLQHNKSRVVYVSETTCSWIPSAVSIEHRLMTDRQTDKQTDGVTD